jgi:cellulose synthase (UDP-forming)
MLDEALAPNLIVLGAMVAIAGSSARSSNVARSLIALIAIAATLRYIWWRWDTTVAPLDFSVGHNLFILACFLFELLVAAAGFIGNVMLARTVNRKHETNENERWVRSLPLDDLPTVDVFIPTYNEERDVLERTIVGALSIDYPKLRVWILDDSRRPWLKEMCESKGAGYLTRPDNRHAKAGNINAAIPKTDGDLIAVLDADFVARRNFLWRTIGYFRTEKVVCVQTPQYFFNTDPLQTNLGLGRRWVDDQRLFFDVVMPSRDAWGAAFCCGTGFVMRRSAIERIGGIPTGSICEDMLTSMEWKRLGLETVYINEELCIGLAPESVNAFFVQRNRWARGNIQIMFLKQGAFGRGLPFMYRLFAIPLYYLVQLPARIYYVSLPVFFLATGIAPGITPDAEQLMGHLGPAMIAGVGQILWLGKGAYFPILTDASELFIATKVGPHSLMSLVKPFGTPFKVTPKGAAAKGNRTDRVILYFCLFLLAGTIFGLVANLDSDWRVVNDSSWLGLSIFWAVVNSLVLGLTAAIAREGPRYRQQERFDLHSPARCAAGATIGECVVTNLSWGGAFLRFGNRPAPDAGATVAIDIPSVGLVQAMVVRKAAEGVGVRFIDLPQESHDAIRAMAAEAEPNRRGSRRKSIRLTLGEEVACAFADLWTRCRIEDASLTGMRLRFTGAPPVRAGDRLTVEMAEVGLVTGTVRRVFGQDCGVQFEDMPEAQRDLLIRHLYTTYRPVAVQKTANASGLISVMAARLFGADLA